MNLVEILSKPEGKTLEFKRDLTSPEGVLRTVVVFANTSGGRTVIGIDDGTKRAGPVANLIADSIAPKLIPSLDVLPWRKTQLLLIEIHPSQNRPHHLIRLGADAGVFVHVGSTSRRADPLLIEELKRYGQVTSFDEQPVPELNSEAVDFRVASDFFQPVRKLMRSDLKTLKLTTNYRGPYCPHNRRHPPVRHRSFWSFSKRMDSGRSVRWPGQAKDSRLHGDSLAPPERSRRRSVVPPKTSTPLSTPTMLSAVRQFVSHCLIPSSTTHEKSRSVWRWLRAVRQGSLRRKSPRHLGYRREPQGPDWLLWSTEVR